jgi:CheY-like chemotaxis protein
MNTPSLPTHWLVALVRAARWPGATGLNPPASLSIGDAWRFVAEGCAVSLADVRALVAEATGLPLADFTSATDDAAALIPVGIARRRLVVPLRIAGDALVVATADPFDHGAFQELSLLVKRPISLTVGEPDAIENALLAQNPAAGKVSRRVLVVEDNGATRGIVRALLKSMQVEVVEAVDGDIALEVLRVDGQFDALLVDLELPGISGRELLALAQTEALARFAPRIVLTATAESGAEEELRQLGVSGYLEKPLDPRGFKSYMTEVLMRAPTAQVAALAESAPLEPASAEPGTVEPASPAPADESLSAA